jgi:Zn-dependent oligopeptidase
MNNPFLNELLDRDTLPRYDLIAPEHVAPAIDQLLCDARTALASVTDAATPVTWQAVMEPLTDATERLSRAWSAVHHMSGVMDSPQWREAINSRLAQVSEFWTELAQRRCVARSAAGFGYFLAGVSFGRSGTRPRAEKTICGSAGTSGAT